LDEFSQRQLEHVMGELLDLMLDAHGMSRWKWLCRIKGNMSITSMIWARKGWPNVLKDRPTTSTVSTCKAAVVHLARILSAELVDRGIRVNTLSPGPTDAAASRRRAGRGG
jgi:NAD(P)-dependent dehydrogenase (short-subunit alcohol dehydrogenase family)